MAGIGAQFATAADLARLEAFVELHRDEGLDGRDVQLAIEKVRHNIKWLERNTEPVRAFFAERADAAERARRQ